jgi:hypothetical protein
MQFDSIRRRYKGGTKRMRKYGMALFAAALMLIPGLANAKKIVSAQEPGTVSMLGAGLLGLACFCGALTVKRFIAGRRPKFTSTTKP